VLEPWFSGFRLAPYGDAARGRRLLLCVLAEEPPAIRVNARVSSDSRALTILQVAGKEP
jgi:hypothetical protein